MTTHRIEGGPGDTPPGRIDATVDLAVSHRAHVVRVRVAEALSEVTSARIELASPDDLATDELLRTDARVSFTLNGAPQRSFALAVGRVLFRGMAGGLLRYELQLFPRLWFLRFTCDTRKFRKTTTREIVTDVLHRYGIAHRYQLTRDTWHRNFVTQYHESGLDFVHRQLALEGIYYRFEPDGTLLLEDRSSMSPYVGADPARTARFGFSEASGALVKEPCAIYDLFHRLEVSSGRVTLNDYDWKNPRLDLVCSSSKEAEEDGDLEVYDYPGGFRKPDDGAFMARTRLQAIRAFSDRIEAKSNIPAFAAGHRFELDAGDDELDGEYLLAKVEHVVERHGFEGDSPEISYENVFTAIPSRVPFRPRPAERPRVMGHHTAMVVGPQGEEIHTDRHGRFKVKFHWDREASVTDADSRWIRLTQETATSMQLARVGWEMSIGYVDGDPDRPIGLARQINGAMPPTYPLPAKKSVMSVRTPTYPSIGGGGYNELRLDDQSGAMSFDMKAQRDMTLLTKRDKTESIGQNETHVTTGHYRHTVGGDQTQSIGADSKLEGKKGGTWSVVASRTVAVAGNETEHSGSGASVSVGGDEREVVGALRLTVAAKMNLPNPIAALKDAIPTPEKVVDALKSGAVAGLDAATGGSVSRVQRVVGQASAVGDMIKKTAGAKGGGARELEAGCESICKFAKSVGDPKQAFSEAMTAIQQAGGITGVVDASIHGAVASVKSLAPDPKALFDEATGGLSSAKSTSEALDKLLFGQINRSAEEQLRQLAGGARVVVSAQGDIRANWGAICAEGVGGAKVTLAKSDVTTTVAGPYSLTVGAAIHRIASTDLSYSADDSEVSIRGDASVESKEAGLLVEAPTVTLRASDSVLLSLGGAAPDGAPLVELSPSGVALRGNIVLKATSEIKTSGLVNLTRSKP